MSGVAVNPCESHFIKVVGGRLTLQGIPETEREVGGKGGSSRCKQARNDSFPEKMLLEFANRRPRHQSGFNKILKAEHRV